MVQTLYLCKACHFLYPDREAAAQCERWCRKYRSCNTELTKKSLGSMSRHEGTTKINAAKKL